MRFVLRLYDPAESSRLDRPPARMIEHMLRICTLLLLLLAMSSDAQDTAGVGSLRGTVIEDYIRQKDIPKLPKKWKWPFQTKLELAVRLLEWVAPYVFAADKSLCIVADGFYA